jgi:hypothetical protein
MCLQVHHYDTDLSYFKKTANKIALRLQPSSSGQFDIMTRLLVYCCNFHGCGKSSHRVDQNSFCSSVDAVQAMHVARFGRSETKWYETIRSFHYSRSLEKYALKAKTWETANGEGSGYQISGFLERSVGWELDRRALRYSCQLREILRVMTGEKIYYRPGDVWMRNVEFGRPMTYPGKGMRFDRPIPAGFVYSPKNPYVFQSENTTIIDMKDNMYD